MRFSDLEILQAHFRFGGPSRFRSFDRSGIRLGDVPVRFAALHHMGVNAGMVEHHRANFVLAAEQHAHQVDGGGKVFSAKQGIASKITGIGDTDIIHRQCEIGKTAEQRKSEFPELYFGVQVRVGLILYKLDDFIFEDERGNDDEDNKEQQGDASPLKNLFEYFHKSKEFEC